MDVIKRSIVTEENDMRVSVAEFSNHTFSIAVQYNDGITKEKWEIDYSVFPDTLEAHSEMEVYGLIQNIIAPAYLYKYGIDFTL